METTIEAVALELAKQIHASSGKEIPARETAKDYWFALYSECLKHVKATRPAGKLQSF